jgi:hypothetical protein
MARYIDDEEALLRAAASAVVDRTDKLAVRGALERFLERQPRHPDLIGATAAAKTMGVNPPYITRLKDQDRLVGVPVEGSTDVYIRAEVEALGEELEAGRIRRARRRARERCCS